MRRSVLTRRTPLSANPDQVREFVRRGVVASKSKHSRPISLASDSQRELVRTVGFCIVCGGSENLDPAHIIDRSLLTVGQDDERAVVPLDRRCHDLYDRQSQPFLDLLPYLEQDRWREHLGFAVARFGLVRTLERVTNERWAPRGSVLS